MIEMLRWRFYAEDLRHTSEGANDFDKFITSWFPGGCTIYNAEGIWHGGQEMSLIIEVLCDGSILSDEDANKFAEAYKTKYNQETVLITTETVQGYFA